MSDRMSEAEAKLREAANSDTGAREEFDEAVRLGQVSGPHPDTSGIWLESE